MEPPTTRLAEQVELAHELMPDAIAVRPVWKAASSVLDVGALVWTRSERTGEKSAQVVSLKRGSDGKPVIL